MKQITCYLDFISPYAYLAFEHLPEALKGTSYSVDYTPVLFAGILKHHGQLGPAEITPKRDWTYRHVLWLAHTLNIPLQMPVSHPFNPLPLLRLALACSPEGRPGTPNRYVCESIFRHVWRGGAEASDPQRIESLGQLLIPHGQVLAGRADPGKRDSHRDAAKAQLKKNTEDAIAKGVFGVPAFAVDDKLFWGLDSLPMLREYLVGGAWFDGPDWTSAADVKTGVRRI